MPYKNAIELGGLWDRGGAVGQGTGTCPSSPVLESWRLDNL
ncbi:MAG: hypothetical protein ACOX4M_01280 [Acetivibrionales bacterium]